MKCTRRITACTIVLMMLLTACGEKKPQSSGLVPMETAKSYEHVAKTEVEPTPLPDDAMPSDQTGIEGEDGGASTPTKGDGGEKNPDAGNEDIVYVAVSKLNLRTAPSLDSDVVAQVKYGESFVRTEKGTDGWDKLLYNGKEVYAYAEYLTNKKIAGGQSSISASIVADAKKK